MANPIPTRLLDEFCGYMDFSYRDTEAGDGAWFQMLVDDATDFMKEHKLRGDANDAVHQLLTVKANEKYTESLVSATKCGRHKAISKS